MSSIRETEQDKYRDIWSFPQYRAFSPGEQAVPRFLSITKAKPFENVCDFGCGEGKGLIALADEGFLVDAWDFVDVRSVEAQKRTHHWMCQPLWQRMYAGRSTRWGFCIDVMEHIPPEFTMLAVDVMTRYAKTTYFEIATEPDAFGTLIGQPLHLTVQPFTWWRDRLREVATVLDARDLLDKAVFLVEAR